MGTTFINEQEKWPKIVPKDASALREFSDLLDKVLAQKDTIPGLSVLDYAKDNVKLLATSPYNFPRATKLRKLVDGKDNVLGWELRS